MNKIEHKGVELTEEQIRRDNKHFGPVIRIVEPVTPYKSKAFKKLTHTVTVGAVKSYIDHGEAPIDAWASYLWNSETGQWVLGAN